MNEFERRLRDADPAKHLEPQSEGALQEVAVAAIAAEPHPIHRAHRRRNWRRGLAAAAVVGLFAIPSLQGAMTASDAPPVLRLAGTSNGVAGAENAMTGAGDAKMASDSMGMWWGGYNYVADVALSTEGTTGLAYQMVTWPDAEAKIMAVADYFEVARPTLDAEYGYWSSNRGDGSTADAELWANIGEWASFGYYNTAVDPWRECWDRPVSDSKGDTTGGSTGSGSAGEPAPDETYEVCEPAKPTNLPTASEGKQVLVDLLKQFDISTTGLQFDVQRDDYYVWVYATKLIDGVASPLNWYVSLVDDSKVQSFGGALSDMQAVGTYDLISPAAAIERANEQTAKIAGQWSKDQPDMGVDEPGAVEPGVVEPGVVEPSANEGSSEPGNPGDDTATIEPVEPTFGPMPVWEPVTVHVTKVTLGMQLFTTVDGANLWLPTYEFWGYTDDNPGEQWQYGSVVAVVDSQIDLSSFYGYYGVMPMLRGGAVD